MGGVETNVKQGGVIGGWVCFAVGLGFMFLSLWMFIFYVPLFVASFVLSIVAMAQRRIGGGLALLLCTVIVPALVFLGLVAVRVTDTKRSLSTPSYATPGPSP